MPTSLPLVGLEAVISGLPGFEAGAKAITSAYDSIEKKAQNVEKATNILGSSFSSLSFPISNLAGNFVGLGQGVLKFGAIAGGAALLGVGALTAGIVALGGTALQEVAKYERMSLSITNLVAREISQGQVIQQQRQVAASLTAKETKELENLKTGIDNEINDRDVLAARIQEQQERIRQLTDQYGENGLVVIKERAELEGMRLDLSDLDTEINTHQSRIVELSGKEGQLVTVMEKVRTGQMSMTEAMTQAGPKAQELLKWIQMLAIQSPFTQEGIANAFQTMLAYGFTTDKAKELTIAMVDFTSATGKTEEAGKLIALALGQIQARGKVAAQELRQLFEQGVGTNQILERMGFTLDDVTNGLVPTDKFIQAVIDDMKIFEGAAKTQATTFAGLMASLEDLKSIGLREFFGGTFEAIKPYLADFVSGLTDAALNTGKLREMGNVIGTYVAKGIKIAVGAITQFKGKITELTGAFAGGGLFGKRSGSFGSAGLLAALGLSTETVGQIENLFNQITGAYQAFVSGGLFGGAEGGGLLAALGFSPETQTVIQNVFNVISTGIQTVIGFLSGLSFNEILGGLTGIGAVLATGVFAALVAGILSLLTPINLIIAGAAVLGAAWAGNWGDIQGKTYAAWATIKPVLQQIWTWLQVNIPIAIQTASIFWTTTLQPAMMNVSNWITGTLIPILTNIWNWLSTNLPIAVQANANIWNNILLPAFTAVSNFISTVTIPFFSSLANLISSVLNVAVQANAGLWQNILMPVLTRVYDAIKKLADQINVYLSPFLKNLGKTVSEDVSPIVDYFSNDLLPSLTSGLKTVTEWIKQATDYFNDLAKAVDKFKLPDVLTPGSPPPMAIALQDIANAAGVAKTSVNALISGMTSASPVFNKMFVDTLKLRSALGSVQMPRGQAQDISKLTQLIAPSLAGQLEGGKFGKSDLMAGLQKGVSFLGGNTSMVTVLDAIKRFGFNLDEVTGKINNAFNETQKLVRLQNAAQAVGVAGQIAQFGTAAADRLAGQIETLTAIVESGEAGAFAGKVIEATQAQELLNAALEEQASIQNEINDLQRQQQDLQWLQSQLSLIQMVRDAGLNTKDVFAGITFGLDASIPEIVQATNNVVQAMLNQIDSDLKIQSPSQVMISKMKLVGAGMVEGLLAVRPAIQRAFSDTMQTLIDVPAGLAGGVSNQNTTNNNFSMSVTTGANPQEVIQSYQVMRAMV